MEATIQQTLYSIYEDGYAFDKNQNGLEPNELREFAENTEVKGLQAAIENLLERPEVFQALSHGDNKLTPQELVKNFRALTAGVSGEADATPDNVASWFNSMVSIDNMSAELSPVHVPMFGEKVEPIKLPESYPNKESFLDQMLTILNTMKLDEVQDEGANRRVILTPQKVKDADPDASNTVSASVNQYSQTGTAGKNNEYSVTINLDVIAPEYSDNNDLFDITVEDEFGRSFTIRNDWRDNDRLIVNPGVFIQSAPEQLSNSRGDIDFLRTDVSSDLKVRYDAAIKQAIKDAIPSIVNINQIQVP